ncbi:MAG: PVC-type heme-binding CxxCH protein [bacterium]
MKTPAKQIIFRLTASLAMLFFAQSASAQVDAPTSAKMLKPAEGLQATLWASEPMVVNPTTIDIDSRGRVWVTEGLNYRLHRNTGRKMDRIPDADAIKILEDTDGDGKADKSTVFADKIFPVPMGIAVEEKYDKSGKYLGCKVYVGNSPNLLVLEDTNGDDRADVRYPLLTGFGGIDSDHGVHGMTLGIDGKLYFTHGDGCCSVQLDGTDRVQNFDVTDKSGRKVTTDQLATTLRVNRDGTQFEILADRQRNNYETSQDSFGTLFTSDNDDDGRRGSRVIWIMDGGRYGYRTPGSPRHWGEDVPGNVPKLAGTGNGSPCGIFTYEGSLFGPTNVGSLLEADAGTRQINWFPVTRHGATYQTLHNVFLASEDPWFRPVDAASAHDGSVFVADWYDAGVGGHAFRDQTTGRIYLVTPKGQKAAGTKPDFTTIDGLIAALGSPATATRDTTRRLLIERKDESKKALASLLQKPGDARLKARALWVWHAIDGDPVAAFALVNQDEPRLREQVVRILGRDVSRVGIVTLPDGKEASPTRGETNLNALLGLVDDPDSGVRRELILALRDVPTAKAGDALKKLVKSWDGHDRWYLEALGLALQNRESDYIASLFDGKLFGDLRLEAAGRESGMALPPYFPIDRNEAFIPTGNKDLPSNALTKSIGLAWRLHRPESLEMLAKIRPALQTPELQQAWDDVLRQMTDSKAAEVVARLAHESGDPARTRQILDLLAEKLEGDWKQARNSTDVKSLIASALKNQSLMVQGVKLAARSGDDALVNEVEKLLKNAETAEPVRIAALQGLALSKPAAAATEIQDILNATKPKKNTTDLAEAAIRLIPAVEGGKAGASLQKIITDADLPLPVRRESLRTIAATVPGARRIIEMAKEGKLPAELKTEATTTLYAHINRNIREDAEKVLPPPKTADGRTLPPIFELVRREGNAERGQKVFHRQAANACASCHRVAGRGRWVGPDLSTIGVKYGREELLQSILNPSAAVGYNYRPYVLALKDGRILTGLPLEESPAAITIKTAEGKTERITRADIEETTISPVSLMPEGLAQTMTDAELVDLLAYLGTLRRPSSVVGQFQALGPVKVDGKTEAIDVAGVVRTSEPVKSADGKSIAWRRVSANAEGLIDLASLGLEKGQSAYLWTVAVAPSAQQARLVLDSAAPARVWVNGREEQLVQSGDQESREVTLDLVKGSNPILLRVEQGASLGLTFVSDLPVEFRESVQTSVSTR